MVTAAGVDTHRMFLWCEYAWLVFLAIWVIAATKTKPAVRKESPISRTGVSLILIAAYILLFVPWYRAGILTQRLLTGSGAPAATGFAITIIGIAFACWARFYIGGNWSSAVTVKQHHELIRTGPYAFVRHPIYTGILLAFLGSAIALGQIRGLISVVIAAIALRTKSLVEEAFMQQEFPAEYRRYMREVKAIVPLIW